MALKQSKYGGGLRPGGEHLDDQNFHAVACEQFNAAIVNGIIYTIGGATNNQGIGASLNLVQAYNPVMNAWTIAPNMPTARDLAGVGVISDTVYVIGEIKGRETTLSQQNEAFAPQLSSA